MTMERRTFVKLGGLAALGLIGAETGAAQTAAPEGTADVTGAAAIATPSAEHRWAMVIDTSVCRRDQGCTDCIAACHRVHNVPALPDAQEEVKWIWKEPLTEALPDVRQQYLPEAMAEQQVLVFCNHCDVPACTKVCPTGATWKREDGIVMMDWHRCIGCRYCIAACPYGSRSFNWRDPRPYIAQVDPAFPTRTRGVVEKCNLCEERLADGLPPACVEGCPQKAMVFGDLKDPTSEVRRRLAERPALRRRPSLGTEPQVYYLL